MPAGGPVTSERDLLGTLSTVMMDDEIVGLTTDSILN